MAEIAVSVAIKQAEGLVGKLVSTVSGELSLLLGVRGEIQYIIDELEVMSAFLRRAEEKQNSDPAAKAWVKQVKDLSYAVEDCIDEFVLHLLHSNKENRAATLWRHARSLSSLLACRRIDAGIQSTRLLGSLQARHRIASNIQSIKSRAKEVSKRRLRYGIDEKVSNTSNDDVSAQHDPQSTAQFVEESQLVGIEGPRDELVKWLLDDQQCLSLMAVVGTSGIGKTTIVKRAMESPMVTGGHFACRAWITVSQVYQIEELLRDMIIQICSLPPKDLETKKDLERTKTMKKDLKTMKDLETKDLETMKTMKDLDTMKKSLEKMKKTELTDILKKCLEDKRYAIVFDDIWEVGAWKSLEVLLQKKTNGSKIIITTSNDDVVRAALHDVIPGETKEIHKLSEGHSRDLFCKRVFHEEKCPLHLYTLSQNILDKCDGLPLAIVATAAALASKPRTKKEWKGMLQHFSTELKNNPNLQGVMHVLNFSYANLPYHVKQCFLYLSKFPKDSSINCNRIKRLWVAEGLVSDQRDMTAEGVADSYLNVLISRRLIHPLVFTVTGELKSFKVHNVMMEMIVSKSMEENFVHVLKQDSKWLPHGVIRRLSTHTEHVREDINLSFVRSMTMFGDDMPSLLSESPAFKLLRVLDLDGCGGLRNEHLMVICGLLHLKYLSIRDADDVDILPDSIGNLGNLETLDFRGSGIEKIPPKILNLKKLRFLRGDDLIVPTKIGKLRAIQELGFVVLKRGMAKELRYLDQLKKLRVGMEDFEGKDESDFCDFLEMEDNSLRSLGICTNSSLTFLKDLSSAPVTLEKLSLDGSLGTLPEWASSLCNLQKIIFSKTELGVDAIQALGALPNLLELVLQADSYCEEKLAFGAGGFPSLKVLRCNGVFSCVRSLVFEQGALPSVESVHMINFVEGAVEWTILGLGESRLPKDC